MSQTRLVTLDMATVSVATVSSPLQVRGDWPVQWTWQCSIAGHSTACCMSYCHSTGYRSISLWPVITEWYHWIENSLYSSEVKLLVGMSVFWPKQVNISFPPLKLATADENILPWLHWLNALEFWLHDAPERIRTCCALSFWQLWLLSPSPPAQYTFYRSAKLLI